MQVHSNPLIRKLQALFPLSAEEERVLVQACSRTARFQADEDILVERDRPADCNLLLEGYVCRYKLLPDGKRQILSFHCAGDIFDAQSFVLEVMDHSIAALTACKVALIPHRTMLEITESYPRIARAIWKDTLIDAAIFREWMTSIGRRSAYSRIAHQFCEVYTKLETVGLAEGYQFTWPITQSDIADSLGLSNIHVNRTLKELRAAGLMSIVGREVTIHDWAGLMQAGQFNPMYMHLRPADEPDRASGEIGSSHAEVSA